MMDRKRVWVDIYEKWSEFVPTLYFQWFEGCL